MKKELKIDKLIPHPMNREFEMEGEVWDDFVASIEQHGVVESLFVRPAGGDEYQVLAGHRRLAAARQAGMMILPCQVVKMDDKQALIFLINSNLQRENPNLVQEAKLVRELQDMGMTDAEVMSELSREVEWLRVRQMVFQFDAEVVQALETGSLSEGALREVLMAPGEIRDRALEVVLYGGEHSDEPMSAERARQFIQFSLIPDWEKQTEWENNMEKMRKQVVRDLKKLCDGGGDLSVCVMPWGRGTDGLGVDLVPAREVVPVEYLSDGVEHGKAWVAYAEKIGAPVYVVPPDKTHHDKRLLVSRRVLLDEAAARLAAGMTADLLPRERAKKSEAVAKAEAALDGEGELDYDEEEPVAPVATSGAEDGLRIEQKMQHHAWVDMGEVKRVAMWAICDTADPANAPEYVPQWAVELAYEGRWSTIDAILNWMQGLKKKI